MQQKTYPVTVLCRVMQVSTSAYYEWLKARQDSDKDQQDQKLAEKARQIFIDNKQCFGSRRLADRLQKQGHAVGRFKTRRIMRDLKLKVRYPRRVKVTTDSNHNEAISPNRLDRQFQVAKPNQVWTTDITYVWTLQGWLYVAVVIDLFSRQVVGWAIDDHMRTSLCVKALQMAFWRRKPPPGLLHHSDRGSQYASREYRRHLEVMKMEQSMSRKGNCWDNSPTERFFRSLKHEQLNYEKFKTQEAAKLSVIDYLAFYNGRRSHSILGYQTPLEFEREFYRNAA
ncbi:IS3 family transposase [Candidatus Methylospira mobilis]|uniref:IS3 family transposase n=1 Tax=Candidatus Methylospira mobilis TaxID=1808979 RepID=UPI002240F4BC|nr:IS3 family transposase [Candidatus Methylospira mobilis]